MPDEPWLKPLDADIRGDLRQQMTQRTDGQRTTLTPRAAVQSSRKRSSLVPVRTPIKGTPVPTFPLTATTAAIAAAAAVGTGGVGGSNTYQTFYALLLAFPTTPPVTPTAAQTGAVAITQAIAADNAPIFAAFTAQDNAIGVVVNSIIGQIV